MFSECDEVHHLHSLTKTCLSEILPGPSEASLVYREPNLLEEGNYTTHLYITFVIKQFSPELEGQDKLQ